MPAPTGTITFLFSDIEGSTHLWEQHPQTMRLALARHDALMHQIIADQEGSVFKTIGDAFCAAFHTAIGALMAALNAQQSLQNEIWPDQIPLRVRMAVHTGAADERDGDYFGPTLNRVARLLSAGYGGQVLFSQTAYELIRDALPPDCALQDLGSHSLPDLSRPEQVYQLLHPDLRADFPPLKSLNHLPNNLPQQITSFVGREQALTEVKGLLEKSPLLTLTGSGGAGKTRLSLQVAADVLESYPDGVWLVELAALTDPSLVPQAVATVLDVQEQPDQPLIQTLCESLQSKTLLLILDNCEHLMDACAAIVTEILRACPQVKIMTSSREALNVTGEQTYRVPSLSLPDPAVLPPVAQLSQYEAVRLFIDRALLVKPDFTITNENAPAVASICHRVDGIPLAIELAVARIRSLSVEEVNQRLDNRFRLLTGGSRTALPRQQTLRALIDWSYNLLSDSEKALLRRLSVFSGGWTLAAAESVCAGEDIEDWEVIDLLTSLMDKSLVQSEETEGQTRYRFLETIRHYSRDRLAETDEGLWVREQHRDYFLQFAEESVSKLSGPEQAQWLSFLEREKDNLRQAVTFCLEEAKREQLEGFEKGLRLGAAVLGSWAIRGHISEARELSIALLSHPDAQMRTKARADALHSAGVLAWMQGDYATARAIYDESLSIRRELNDRQGIANSLNNLGNVAYVQGDYETAGALYQESLALQREIGNARGIAKSLGNLGLIAMHQGEYETARAMYEESLAALKELGDQRNIGNALHNLAIVVNNQGDYNAARSLYHESLAICRELGDKQGEAQTLNSLGLVAFEQSDFETAQTFYGQSLTLCRELGDQRGMALCLLNLASVIKEQGDFSTAQSQYIESLTIHRALGDKPGIALCLLGLGHLASQQGDFASAQSYYAESLTIQQELEDKHGIANSLDGFAVLNIQQGDMARATCLSGAVDALRESIGTPRTPRENQEYQQRIATMQEALGNDAFATAQAQGQAMSWEQAVEYAMGE